MHILQSSRRKPFVQQKPEWGADFPVGEGVVIELQQPAPIPFKIDHREHVGAGVVDRGDPNGMQLKDLAPRAAFQSPVGPQPSQQVGKHRRSRWRGTVPCTDGEAGYRGRCLGHRQMTEGGPEPSRILLGNRPHADVVSADSIPLLDGATSRGGIVQKRLLESIKELPSLGGGGTTHRAIGFDPRSHQCFEVVINGGAAVRIDGGIHTGIAVHEKRVPTELGGENVAARGGSVDVGDRLLGCWRSGRGLCRPSGRSVGPSGSGIHFVHRVEQEQLL